MSGSNSMTFSLGPEFSSVDELRRAVDKALQGWFGTAAIKSAATDFCQIIGELVNNAIEHGGCRVIEAKLYLDKERALFTLVTDGAFFDTASSPAVMPEVDAAGELPEGGFGLAIIRELADSLHYEYRDGKNITEVGKIFKEGHNGTQDRA